MTLQISVVTAVTVHDNEVTLIFSMFCKVKLRFVDFGIVDEVSRSSLCPLPKELVDIPFLVS